MSSDPLAALLEAHQPEVDYAYETVTCSCGWEPTQRPVEPDDWWYDDHFRPLILQPAAPAEGLDLDGKPFCPSGFAQRYHAIGECDCSLDPNSPKDVERLAQALCRRDGYVWTNEPEWQREEWKGKARDLLRALYNIDRERAALEANHE